MPDTPYHADSSLYGKMRRRLARLWRQRPAQFHLRRPMITFAFDDAPRTATEQGAKVLERFGARGTFFISAGLMGQPSHFGPYADAEAVKAVAARGHEIACHTYSHLDCGRASAEEIADDIARNQSALKALGVTPQTFAYPYGDVSPQAKDVVAPIYLASRALHHGLIVNGTDLNQVPAVGIEGSNGEAVALSWIEEAFSHKGWLVLYTHDVQDRPSDWGCTPDALERLLLRGLALGFDVVTFEEGARRARAFVLEGAA